MDELLTVIIAFLIVQIGALAVFLGYRKSHTAVCGTTGTFFDVGIWARAVAMIPALILVTAWFVAFVMSDGDLHEALGSPVLLGVILLAIEIPVVLLYIPSIRRL